MFNLDRNPHRDAENNQTKAPNVWEVSYISDFTRARGAYTSTSATCGRFGDWWTRSPGNLDSYVENVERRGCIDAIPFCNYVNDIAAGVRPCIIVDKDALKYDS